MYDDEEKITLDRQTFKILASDTRVDILKSLKVRRKTLSELSKGDAVTGGRDPNGHQHAMISCGADCCVYLVDRILCVQNPEEQKNNCF